METNPRVLRVALAQLNPTVGDLEGNGRKVVEWTERAREAGADVVAFPELFLTGYPPEDLLLKPSFIRDNLRQLEKVAAAARGIALVVGFVDMENDIYNAAAFAFDGQVKGVYHKYYLPNYGVFDEERYFRRGARSPIFVYQGVRIGVSICEDAWYPSGPLSVQALYGAELLVNINGSPYHAGKREARETMIRTRAMDARAFMAWVNTSGGQDELVFDGNSLIYGPEGQVIAHAPSFEEALLVGDLDAGSVFGERLHDTRLRREAQEPVLIEMAVSEVAVGSQEHAPRKWLRAPIAEPLDGPAEVYAAVVIGTRDYVHKNGFAKVVLGLSGGIDSALTAAIAADALGPQNVIAVLMPSRYTSAENLEDAAACAEALGIQLLEIPIDPAHKAFEGMFKEIFRDTEPGVAEENVQPRIRGLILMGLSNKFGYLLLSTGNKSELATGYCTLYGDMAGGFAVLKDIPKTLVYELCRYRNSLNGKAIPERILSKAPSAELRENQKDSDSLPPYEALDPILRGYVEDDRSYEELVAAGHDPATVTRVIQLVDRSEYKRRQAPPGVKITPRAFGRDRRMPLTNRYAADGKAPAKAPTRKSRR
ncbi:MAG: NAD+ synthase [Candidatus Dormibacteraeota bacterium]|nr:NAD+ synthase [Candidatus Dormibacteraeota bacterium]